MIADLPLREPIDASNLDRFQERTFNDVEREDRAYRRFVDVTRQRDRLEVPGVVEIPDRALEDPVIELRARYEGRCGQDGADIGPTVAADSNRVRSRALSVRDILGRQGRPGTQRTARARRLCEAWGPNIHNPTPAGFTNPAGW